MKPNDGLCHLNNDGGYTHSTTQDYPSVSQINQKVKESSVNLIFAVTKEQYHIYEQLNKHVEGASCGVLSNDSSNVVELVQEQYNVSTKILFTDSIPHCYQCQYVAVESVLSRIKIFLS